MGFLSKAGEIKKNINTAEEISDIKFHEMPQKPQEPDEGGQINSFGIHEGLEGILDEYYKMNSSIGGVIIDIPKKSKSKIKKLSSMVSHFATVEELSSHRYLVLFPESLDQELIAHRLKNSLGNEIPLIFSAGNPAEALQKIQPYQ